MGCSLSRPSDVAANRRKPGSIGEVAVFVPGLRIPKNVDLSQALGDCLPKSLLDHFSALRSRIVVMAAQEASRSTKSRLRKPIRHGGSTLMDLLHALEGYLPILLGLVKDDSPLKEKVQFVWINQEDDAEETVMANAWYEVLSILHLMAVLCLSEANLSLLPRRSSEGYRLRISEESKKASVDLFLKGAGYMDCAIQRVLPQLPRELRKDLPLDLQEEVLRAICMQALGQAVDIQLGLAIDSPKATLAVKRRLACEMVQYWQQALDSMIQLPITDSWAKKHELFLKWKYAEAKAAAYYYHGLILDEGYTEESHGMAVAALQSADEHLRESKKACEAFHAAHPASRNPPPWGSIKYLSEKIPKDTSVKVRINQDLYTQERILLKAPTLPDFALALKPDDYHLPAPDPAWSIDKKNH